MNKAVQALREFPGSEIRKDTSAVGSRKFIPYGRQSINQADLLAVNEVLTSDFLTQGPVVPKFEKAIAQYTEANYGIAVNSATSALHIACLALDIGPGDCVWTTPITFVASANCVLYCGADIDFVDIDPHSYNMSVHALEEKLKLAKKTNTLPRAVIPVHLSGQACDMKGIHALAVDYGFSVIEDASHAIGANYANEPVGNCQFSDITVFSFHPVKIITTAEGGIAVTNNKRLSERMQLLRGHGVTRDNALMEGDSHGPWYYQQVDLGFNYRMTEMQAALGLSQLSRLDNFVNRRHEIAAFYNRQLKGLPITLPWQIPVCRSSWHLYIIRLKLDEITLTHKQVFQALRDADIGVNLHYIPVHTQPYFRSHGFSNAYYPEAEKYYSEAISLPMFPDLNEGQLDRICDTLTRILMQ